MRAWEERFPGLVALGDTLLALVIGLSGEAVSASSAAPRERTPREGDARTPSRVSVICGL